MSRRRKQRKAEEQRQAVQEAKLPNRAVRETIESIAIAVILAFLFRTFEAEAFVIPTGSMAQTLRGQHKDTFCPQCGHRFQASASDEEVNVPASDVVTAVCPICRYTMTVDPHPEPEDVDYWGEEEVRYGMQQQSYHGDRILVTKFTYEFTDPKRWDVVVFKYPGDAKMNYIKRLVGLPGEELQVKHGDIFVRPLGSQEEFQVARKSPREIQAMMQLVHDNHYRPAVLDRAGWPRRWQVVDSGWTITDSREAAKSLPAGGEAINVRARYAIDGSDDQHDRWLRYRHYVPTDKTWNNAFFEQQQQAIGGEPGESLSESARPLLITDFYAYNAGQVRYPHPSSISGAGDAAKQYGLHWVGDLMVKADLQVESDSGELLLDLVEAGRHFTCRIDVATGEATITSTALPDWELKGQTSITAPGHYTLTFANVDDRIVLWDGGSVAVQGDYQLPSPSRPVSTEEDPGDLAPAGIGSRGAAITATHLQVYRDIYYIATTSHGNGPLRDYSASGFQEIAGYDRAKRPLSLDGDALVQFLSDPGRWSVFETRKVIDFKLEDFPGDSPQDQFFMMGDNSPFSKDGRLWPGENLTDGTRLRDHFVERELLIGKALSIYWPHPWHRIPGLNLPFPFFPNFGDMGFVR